MTWDLIFQMLCCCTLISLGEWINYGLSVSEIRFENRHLGPETYPGEVISEKKKFVMVRTSMQAFFFSDITSPSYVSRCRWSFWNLISDLDSVKNSKYFNTSFESSKSLYHQKLILRGQLLTYLCTSLSPDLYVRSQLWFQILKEHNLFIHEGPLMYDSIAFKVSNIMS